MDKKKELKPCPLCDSESGIVNMYVRASITVEDGFYPTVKCNGCLLQTQPYATEAEAIAAWNQRPSPWVAVSERLPQPTENTHPQQSEKVWLADMKEDSYTAVKAWYESVGKRWYSVHGKRVTGTHWKPLPEEEAK